MFWLRRKIVIEEALRKLGYGDDMVEFLKEPMRLLTVRIPVRMDDGKTRVFIGFRAQHNDAVGPTKGGVRFHPDVNEIEVKALSIWMSSNAASRICRTAAGKAALSAIRAKCRFASWNG